MSVRDKQIARLQNKRLQSKLNSTYDPEKALAICELVAEGKTVVEITAMEGFPSRPTLYRWLTVFPEFSDAFERAREISAQSIEDELLTMARILKDKNDFTGVKVQAYNIAMQQLRWSASRRDPGRYGQKTAVSAVIPIQINTTLNLGQDGKEASTTTDSIYTLTAEIPVPSDADTEDDLDNLDAIQDTGEAVAFNVPEVQRHQLSKLKQGRPPNEQVLINKGKHKSEAQIKRDIARKATMLAKKKAKENGSSSGE